MAFLERTMTALRNPLIILTSVAVGILLRREMSVDLGDVLIMFGCSLVAFVFVRQFSGSGTKAIRYARLHYIWIILLFGSLGMASDYINSPVYPDGGRHYLSGQRGRVTEVIQKANGDALTVHLIDVNCKARIFVSGGDFSPGDIILIRSRLFPVSPERSTPGKSSGSRKHNKSSVTPDLSESFVKSQERKGILYSGVAHPRQISLVDHEDNLLMFFSDLRDRLEISIEKTCLASKTKDFLITLLLGDKEYLDPDLRQTFSDVGLSHVLAVSGMHTGIVASVFLALFFPFNAIGRRKWKFALSLVLIWIFTMITGLAPSTVRAAIMMSAIFLGMMLERKAGVGNSLCWAAVLILILSPASLFDPGFQLSFMCVASLSLFCDKLNPFDAFTHRRLHTVAATVLATLVSTGCTWIVVAYYFGTVPVMFLPANLLVLPIIPVYMICALCFFLLNSLGHESEWLAGFLDTTLELTERFCSWISSDGSSVLSVNPSLLSVSLWLIGIAVIALSLHSSGRPKLVASTGVVLLISSLIFI